MLHRPTHRTPTFRSHKLLALFATVLIGFAVGGFSQASASAPAECGQPPSVEVDTSDPAVTTITIAVSCQAEARLARIVTATVRVGPMAVEVLRVDTRTDITAGASHVTTVTIPAVGAEVCVEDPDTREETCLP